VRHLVRVTVGELAQTTFQKAQAQSALADMQLSGKPIAGPNLGNVHSVTPG